MARSRSKAAEAPTTAPRKSTRVAGGFLRGLSLSRFQAVVGTLAGVVSVTGAGFSLVQFVRPADTATGSLVTIVQAAGSPGHVTGATVEVLTTQDALVATLTPDSTGRVTQELAEGVYVVRVSHPRYASSVRRVHVLPRQTVEMRASLRPGSSSPIKRAVNSGVNSVKRAFRF
jgi:hypothetical protein